MIGAGLAGLAAARDLARAGTDVMVLEARARTGGRVEQQWLPDGRPVQLGGELTAEWQYAYLELVAELGLTVGAQLHGARSPLRVGGARGHRHRRRRRPGWTRPTSTISRAWTASWPRYRAAWIRPTPGATPTPRGSTRSAWERGCARWALAPGCCAWPRRWRCSLCTDSIERTSLLAQLRKEAAAGGHGFYDETRWETLRVAEGSATVAQRMTEELGERVRLGCVVESIDVAPGGCAVGLRGGETIGAETVVCALPVGPLRDVTVTGVSPERLESLHRQHSALAFKTVAAYPTSFWAVGGAVMEGIWTSVWIQRDGILSSLTPPDRLGPFLAMPPERRREEYLATVAALMGEEALHPLLHAERLWGIDPFTQGYVTAWRPGDVMAVGPLHGTHEPPFYVCGSDQWVAGYMEGAVRTGRDAAAQALGLGPREFAAAV